MFDIISLGTSIADVALNPTDPWAWIGLIGDVADVMIPFVGGIGEATKVLKKVANSSDIIDDSFDLVSVQKKTLEKISEAAKSLLPKGNNTVYISYKEGLLEYVGITNDFDRRRTEWEGTRDIIEYIPNLDRLSARCVEQLIIELFGRSKYGGVLSNKINSIGVNNKPKINAFVGFIEELF